MKITRSIAIVLLLSSIVSFGQSNDAKRRTIEVKGSSEMEITPNEIFVRITLKEYKKGGDKIGLDQLESELINAIKKLKMDEDKLRAENVYAIIGTGERSELMTFWGVRVLSWNWEI